MTQFTYASDCALGTEWSVPFFEHHLLYKKDSRQDRLSYILWMATPICNPESRDWHIILYQLGAAYCTVTASARGLALKAFYVAAFRI